VSVVKVGQPILETLDEIDLSTISEVDAQEVLKLVIWHYMSRHREDGDTRPKQFAGLYPDQTKERVESEHKDLLIASGFKNGTISMPTLHKYSERGKNWIWERRDRLTAANFRENQELEDEAKRFQAEIMRDETASKGIRLKAAKDLVDTTRTQGIKLGYVAPQRVEVFPGTAKENIFTADEMAQAAAEALEFEQKLLERGEIIDGEIVP